MTTKYLAALLAAVLTLSPLLANAGNAAGGDHPRREIPTEFVPAYVPPPPPQSVVQAQTPPKPVKKSSGGCGTGCVVGAAVVVAIGLAAIGGGIVLGLWLKRPDLFDLSNTSTSTNTNNNTAMANAGSMSGAEAGAGAVGTATSGLTLVPGVNNVQAPRLSVAGWLMRGAGGIALSGNF